VSGRTNKLKGKHARIAIVGALALLALLSPAAAAQQLGLALSQAPYYIGVPIEIEVTAEGFDEEPQPEIKAHGPAAEYLQLVGVTPSVSRSVRIVNGKMTQSSSVRFIYAYRISPPKAGRFQIGPFRVTQGATSKVTGLTNIKVEAVPLSSGQKVRVKIPSGDIFVGQRLPIEIEWWVSPELHGTLFNQRITVPMLDMSDSFALDSVTDTDAKGRQLRTALVISVAGTPAEYRSSESTRNEGGIEYLVRSTKMVVVPLKPGDYDLDPATVTVDQATRWRRDVFGSRVPTQARKIRAADRRRTLRVLDVPTVGRPPGFAGAIGDGFTIDVTADRSVVQVGDPITLTITLRGSGSIESASLPRLIGRHALAARDFRVVRTPRAGRFEGGEKRFEAVIRVVEQGVKEIPPIEFAWFNPEAAEFHTHSSRPIALSVREAQIVGAGDVVRNVPVDEEVSDRAPDRPTTRPVDDDAPARSRRPSFTLTGADLAIERDAAMLTGSSTSGAWQLVFYAAGLALVAMGVYRRSRGEIDVELARAAKRLAEDRKTLSNASLAREIADVLRRMASCGNVSDRDALESALADCDAIAYAPGGAASHVDPDLKRRAVAVAESIEEPRR
jgi:hypothetical protein